MFGFDRLREALRVDDAGSDLLDRLLETLHQFTGPDHEQEDDITLVTLRRSAGVAEDAAPGGGSVGPDRVQPARRDRQRARGDGPRRRGGRRPRPRARPAGASQDRRQRDRHERHRVRQPGPGRRPVRRRRRGRRADDVVVRVTDRALSGTVPTDVETPDIERKLAGEQKPRGWGLFLIEHMVDSMDVSTDDARDPDRDTAPGPRGAHPWMTARSTPRSWTTDDEVAAPDAGRPRQPRRRAPSAPPIGEAVDGGAAGRAMTLDFRDVGYINSTGIALVVRLLADARRDGRAVRAVGLTPHYQEIFRITRLSDFMDIIEGDAA